MAEDDPNRERNCLKTEEDSDSDHDESLRLDLGIGASALTYPRTSAKKRNSGAGPSTSTNESTTKREDNPFSFKHFLRSDTAYQGQGARPKVYCDGRPIASISDLDLHPASGMKQTRIGPEFSSALPDFVQDHLVVEQCYLEEQQQQQPLRDNYDLHVDNLPDFAPYRYNRVNGETSSRSEAANSNGAVPLDLPVRPSTGFPLDLPLGEESIGARSCATATSDGGVSKSLPDFLTDGAVLPGGGGGNENGPHAQSPESEIDRLRRDLEVTRRQLLEQTRFCNRLQRDLEVARGKEQEYTHNLAKALEQVEESIGRSNQRSANADGVIAKLRQEVRSLKNEVGLLRKENRTLAGEEGASGGPSTATSSTDSHTHRLAEELRGTATTAEHSLRQLLLGVNNLRMIAAAIENVNRIEEKSDVYSDVEDDAGPAL